MAGNLKVAEINANGRLSRELAGAVAPDDFAREQNRIIFGEDAQKAVPAKKGDGKSLNTLANPKAEKTENSPTPYQSARQQVRGQILADALDAAAEFSMRIDGETPFYGENAVSKTERIEAARKPDFGNGHEETHSSVPAGETAFLPGTRSHAESVHSPAEHTGNRSTFSGNKSSYSAAANSAGNAPSNERATHTAPTSNESRAAYTVQPTGEDWNAAAETGASYTSVHSREDGSISRKSGHPSSSDHGNASGKTEPMPTPEVQERERMARINANYEHDKAVLAKADPMFARNQFWDVGHAEGSGEESDREIKRATKKLQENMLEKIKGKQL